MNNETKYPLGSILWIISKCGLTVLLCVAAIYYAYAYPDQVEHGVGVLVASIGGFFGTVFGCVSLVLSTIAALPIIATLGICGVYAWGTCVASNLKKRKHTGVCFHYLQITLHKLILLIWLILFAKAKQTDEMLAGIVIFFGGFWCAVHWGESKESKKRLARRKRLLELRVIREARGK